jgi:hypothetical protein
VSTSRPTPKLERQRGAASLAVTMILLLLMAIVVLYVNRGLMFEQRTSANQTRATRAFEIADAGLEWALGMLNANTRVAAGDACTGTATTFRSRFIAPVLDANGLTSAFNVPANSQLACQVNADGTLTCSCPAPGGAFASINQPQQNFRVVMTTTSDPMAVQLTSHGCVNATGVCTPDAAAAGSAVPYDAYARVSVIVKFAPSFRGVPSCPITGGQHIRWCASTNVTNSNPSAAGCLFNSGLNTRISGTYQSGPTPGQGCAGSGQGQRMVTLPGQPLAAAISPNDGNLAAAAVDEDTFWQRFRNDSLEEFRGSACTAVGSTPGQRGQSVVNQFNQQACREFYADGAIDLPSSTNLGSAIDSVLIVSRTGGVTPGGNSTIYGTLFSLADTWTFQGSGTVRVVGGIIVRGNFYINGNLTVDFSAGASGNIDGGGDFAKVPGSWTDENN